jgi:hypothetical protein
MKVKRISLPARGVGRSAVRSFLEQNNFVHSSALRLERPADIHIGLESGLDLFV